MLGAVPRSYGTFFLRQGLSTDLKPINLTELQDQGTSGTDRSLFSGFLLLYSMPDLGQQASETLLQV